MSKKLIVFVVLIVGGLLLIGVLLFNIYRQVRPEAAVNKSAPVVNEPVVSSPEPVLTPEQTARMKAEDEIRRLAIMFVERFGSYSNQSTLNNVTELTAMMSENMKAWAEKYSGDLLKEFSAAKEYKGISTRVISSAFQSFDPAKGLSEVLVVAQREEVKGLKSEPNVFYQQMFLTFRRFGEIWKLDGAYWQKK